MDIAEGMKSKSTKLCFFCNDNESKYSCPRCEEQYCSLDCYKCEKHAECSESFYRDCITEEMTGARADDDSRMKMMKILAKVHKENGGGLPGAEDLMQQFGQENDSDIDSHEELQEEEDDLDSDDDDFLALKDRMETINLDDPEAVWNALTEDERNEFEALVGGGDVSKLVPLWEPWWGYRKESKLVEEVKDNREEEEALKMCPPIKDVPELSVISKTKPADCIKFNIMNVLAAYAFTMRYFNGEQNDSEFAAYLLTVCGSLTKNSNYEDEEIAVGSVRQECINSPIIETDEASLQVMKHDVYLIVKGPSKTNKLHYCNAALSDVHKLLSQTKRAKKNQSNSTKHKLQPDHFSKKFPEHGEEHLHEIDLSKIKNYLKKIEFYLSYIKSYGLSIIE